MFTEKQIYSTKSGGQVFHYQVTKRSSKSIWLQPISLMGEVEGREKRFTIILHNGIEVVYPEGKYSQCPVLKADKENLLNEQEIAVTKEYNDVCESIREYNEMLKELMSRFEGKDLIERIADLDNEYGIEFLQKRANRLKTA